MTELMIPQGLDYEILQSTFETHTLFDEKVWRLSPEPYLVTTAQLQMIKDIGSACYEFYLALETLYSKSKQNKSLLRNKELLAPWISEYYERGKPDFLKEHAFSKYIRRTTPRVIRPDLLITENGFALTELDSVPGGIGLTAFLNQLYKNGGFSVVESTDGMIDRFYNAIVPKELLKQNPVVVFVVSDESETYRPEFQWLSAQLQAQGKRAYCVHPEAIVSHQEGVGFRLGDSVEKIDVFYRFYELFDWENVACADIVKSTAEEGSVVVTPPMRTFQEEKLNLALFHHHLLREFWRENLSKRARKVLNQIIPRSWVMDPVDLPPNGVLDAPWVEGYPIYDWMQLAEASQKERVWIMKRSGFHEDCWGARSVSFGSDCSRKEWEDAIRLAIEDSSYNFHILQDYHKPIRVEHTVYSDANMINKEKGRMRLCPYYFVEDEGVHLEGILATFCPEDKKIIHGMKDACLIPCQVLLDN